MKIKNKNNRYSNRWQRGKRRALTSGITLFEKYIKQRMRQGVHNLMKLHYELQEQGYKGSYASVVRFINIVTDERKPQRSSKHVETKPGEQAQVDWGSCGKIKINGKVRRLYAFVYVLSYSRMTYVEFTTRQTLKTLEQSHINAFKILGIPKMIVYDNMKTVVLQRKKKDKDIYFNPSFNNFAQYYGFNIYLCHPYWPQEKGKVERNVRYIKGNFIQGKNIQKDFSSLDDLNAEMQKWLDNVANVRIHATTEERPIDRWQQEKPYLRFPLDYPVYQTEHFEVRYSTKDGTIQFRSNWYELPLEHARRKLYVKEINNKGVPLLDIYHEEAIIARYFICTGRRQWITLDQSLINSQSGNSRDNNIQATVRVKMQKQINKPSKICITLTPRPLSYYARFIGGEKHE